MFNHPNNKEIRSAMAKRSKLTIIKRMTERDEVLNEEVKDFTMVKIKRHKPVKNSVGWWIFSRSLN